jgi:hypothetical protein
MTERFHYVRIVFTVGLETDLHVEAQPEHLPTRLIIQSDLDARQQQLEM